MLINLGLLFVICCALFNGFGSSVTKYSTVVNRNIAEQTRVITVWMFFLLFTGFGHETFSFVKLFGFILIVTGVLVFNKVISCSRGGGETEVIKPIPYIIKSDEEGIMEETKEDSNLTEAGPLKEESKRQYGSFDEEN
jgi:hypothetical protein